MKCNKLVVNLVTLTLAISPLLVGCKKGPQKPTPIPGIAGTTGADEKPADLMMPRTRALPGDKDMVESTPKAPPTDSGIPMSDRPKSEWDSDGGKTFEPQTVYFALDKSSIDSSEKPKVEEVARRMKNEFQGKAIRIEGHCDERGTEGYNQALGERRALAVREMLVSLGMSADMVETVSYGEDKPAVEGHNEAAWSKNRRAVFLLLTPPTSAASK